MEYVIRERDGEGNLVDAKVFIERTMIDKGTIGQIKKMISHKGIEHARIMPDCHKGVGCCVGFTSILTDKIVPNYIGGDIGCGIVSVPIDLTLDTIDFPETDATIRKVVTMGSGRNCINRPPIVNTDDLELLCRLSQAEATAFADEYRKRFDIDLSKFVPEYSVDWLKHKVAEIGGDWDYILGSLGTLGGGNHFVEINTANDKLYLTLHTGSRNFGFKIKEYHQNKINEGRFDWNFYHEKVNKFKKRCKVPKIQKQYADDLMDRMNEERHTAWLEKDEMYLYFFDMIIAQQYAQLNRRIILKRIHDGLGLKMREDEIIESIHNYIDFRDFIMRKGAIRAHADEKCIVALNMRDGILICSGLSNYDWNYSAAHGSGREVMRQQAASKLSMKKFEDDMEDVYSTSVVWETLDESPMAYKDSELIKRLLEGTVVIEEQRRVILNVKALT